MEKNLIKELYRLLEEIPVTPTNKGQIDRIKEALENNDFDNAMIELQNLKYGFTKDIAAEKEELLSEQFTKDKKDDSKTETAETPADAEKKAKEETVKKPKRNTKKDKKDESKNDTDNGEKNESEEENDEEKPSNFSLYPKELIDERLESIYMGLLLTDPKSISKFYFEYDDCYFASEDILSLYKLVLFSDGEAYAPEVAKEKFNFAKNVEEIFPLKDQFKMLVRGRKYDFEKIYVELRKLFILRKNYLRIPIKSIQDKIIDIINYKLYSKMSIEEVESAVNQAEVTAKFKSAVLNGDVTDFLISGGNNLVNGLELPFPILSKVFKGIRHGETTSFAMPSNAGKSRFTVNLMAHIAFLHNKKVLVISNEMSEEKMKLCLITTVINNPKMQKLHGQDLRITEGELLELKFRPDNPKDVKIDEEGYILRKENESQVDFTARLQKYSSDFNKVLIVTDWISKQMNNSIYFINITEHTDEELSKVVKNYYYKEHLEYIFYDTLKADTAHIGNIDAVKKTATILSNLAQDFNIFIGSTMQLIENSTLPVNLTINDLSSRTVKEVLDTLCLLKQIYSDSYHLYEYSLNEVDTEFFDLEPYEDPNVRYYACVVDKNRAGSKPTLLFRLNLAYNEWEELGYLRLKQN